MSGRGALSSKRLCKRAQALFPFVDQALRPAHEAPTYRLSSQGLYPFLEFLQFRSLIFVEALNSGQDIQQGFSTGLGISSKRVVAWQLADSLGLRRFVGIALDENTPDHTTISRTRRLIDVEMHGEVFGWVLGVLADRGLVKGKRIAIDATTLEANAAMRSIVRRETGESYEEFLHGLAKASGIETPSREDLARLDRKRKKRMSNKEWESRRTGMRG